MSSDDEGMVVIIVGDDNTEDKECINLDPDNNVTIKKEFDEDAEYGIEDLLETAEKHGEAMDVNEFIENIKEELCDVEYLNDESAINSDEDPKFKVENDEDEDDPIGIRTVKSKRSQVINPNSGEKQRHRMLKPYEQYSFIGELSKENPDLAKDEELFISYIAQIMRHVKPPPPPQDFYRINDELKYECIVCEGVFPMVTVITRHYQDKHGPRYLDCFACGADFRSNTNLYKHEKRCLAPDAALLLRARALALGNKGRCRAHRPPDAMLTYSEVKAQARKFPCTECTGAFSTKVGLEAHLHTHRGERPFQCTLCPAAYTSRSALNRHSMKHTNSRYECDLCGRVFQAKTAIIYHMDTHRPLKRYACPIVGCDKRYRQKTALHHHIGIKHMNLPPPCACQVCPKRFPRMSLLKDHMKKAHGLTMMTRTMFFKQLPFLSKTQIEKAKIVLKSDAPGTILDIGDLTKDDNKIESLDLTQDDSEEVSKDATKPADLDLVAQVLESLEDVEEFMRDNEDCETFVVEDGEVQRTVAMADLRQAYDNKKACEILGA